MKFVELDFKPMEHTGGVQAIERFPNGYGVSIVKHRFSYGGPEGLYELAVLKFTGEDWDLTYDTPVTDDVEGRLTPEEVETLLDQVEKLPSQPCGEEES